MQIILLGSNGMLGSYLKKYLSVKYDLISLTRKNIDLTACESDLLSYFNNIVNDGDVIINSAGIIKQRNYCIKDMILVNSILPHILSKIKTLKKCEVIHITTDCVFSGKVGGYIETSSHDCIDDYGKTKSIGENLNNTNIRTSIIGEELYNKASLLEWVRFNRDKTINGYTNHLWNGITCLELSRLIYKIISESLFWQGIRHIYSPNTVSKYELVSMINDVYELNIKIDKTETRDHCFRNISSIYKCSITNDLYKQIQTQKDYTL